MMWWRVKIVMTTDYFYISYCISACKIVYLAVIELIMFTN